MPYLIWITVAFIIVAIIIVALFPHKKPTKGYSSKREDIKERIGKQGEHMIASILGDTIKGEQYVINDLLFCDDNGHSCQIDHILINKYGIWVIETKNYAGMIFGKEDQREWVQVLAYGNEKHTFYNPVKQNETHIFHLSKYLNAKNIFHNIVVFSSRADISNVSANNVYYEKELPSLIIKSNVSLSVKRMEFYYNKLMELKTNSTISNEEHIDNINRMICDIENGICPRCGGKLVLREGKNGKFYGCSNYPKCKFTKNN